jgi:hypothetical protein
MSVGTKRVFITLFMVVVVSVAIEAILVGYLAGPDERERARVWASGLSASERELAITKLESYPVAYRKALSRLSVDMYVKVYLSVAEKYAAAHPDLPEAQRAVFMEQKQFLAFLKASVAKSTPNAVEVRSSLDRLAEHSKSAFPRDVGKYLFGDLGPSDPPSGAREPGRNWFAAWLDRQMTVLASEHPGCDCNIGSWFNCWSCGDPPEGCQVSEPHWEPCEELGPGFRCLVDGCGYGGAYDCDGMCGVNNNQ